MPRYCVAKKAYPFTTVFPCWYEVFVLICCVWFVPNMAQCIVKHLNFFFFCIKYIIPEDSCFLQMWLVKLLCPDMCCFREKRFFSPWPFHGQTLGLIILTILNIFQIHLENNNLFHNTMILFKLFGHGPRSLSRSISSNNCFSNIDIDVFPL